MVGEPDMGPGRPGGVAGLPGPQPAEAPEGGQGREARHVVPAAGGRVPGAVHQVDTASVCTCAGKAGAERTGKNYLLVIFHLTLLCVVSITGHGYEQS